jgi:type IV secretion system protein VirB1
VDLASLVQACAPLVAPRTATAIVQVESARNPFAIGVVRASLLRQPRTLAEAVATVRQLRADGRTFSAGLAQINVDNWARLGLDERTAFEPCANLRAMQTVLSECYTRAAAREPDRQRALRQSLSCYYSGNFTTGFAHGYVDRVMRMAAMTAGGPAIDM